MQNISNEMTFDANKKYIYIPDEITNTAWHTVHFTLALSGALQNVPGADLFSSSSMFPDDVALPL